MFFRPNFRDSNSLTIVMNDYDDDGDGRHKSRQDQVWSMGLTWEKNQIKSRKGPRKITKNNFLSPSLLHQINQNSRTIKPNSFDNEIFNFKFCFSRILFPFFFVCCGITFSFLIVVAAAVRFESIETFSSIFSLIRFRFQSIDIWYRFFVRSIRTHKIEKKN